MCCCTGMLVSRLDLGLSLFEWHWRLHKPNLSIQTSQNSSVSIKDVNGLFNWMHMFISLHELDLGGQIYSSWRSGRERLICAEGRKLVLEIKTLKKISVVKEVFILKDINGFHRYASDVSTVAGLVGTVSTHFCTSWRKQFNIIHGVGQRETMESIAQNWLRGFPGDCLQFVAVCLIGAEMESQGSSRAVLGLAWPEGQTGLGHRELPGELQPPALPSHLALSAELSWAGLGWPKAILATCLCYLSSFEASPGGWEPLWGLGSKVHLERHCRQSLSTCLPHVQVGVVGDKVSPSPPGNGCACLRAPEICRLLSPELVQAQVWQSHGRDCTGTNSGDKTCSGARSSRDLTWGWLSPSPCTGH